MSQAANIFDLSGRQALITGASGGLGEHFARVLAEAGASVWLAARRMEKLEKVAESIQSNGSSAETVEMDVTAPQSVEAAFTRMEEKSGKPCDIIINNSGVAQSDWLVSMDEENWQSTIDTNLTGVWRVAKNASKALIKAGLPGSIINICSITGLRPLLMNGAYATSKAAVDHLTRLQALELARYKIRVNALAPGFFQTAMIEDLDDSELGAQYRERVAMKRFGHHAELDGPLLLLASDAGAYMTGSTLTVDGGHMLTPL